MKFYCPRVLDGQYILQLGCSSLASLPTYLIYDLYDCLQACDMNI